MWTRLISALWRRLPKRLRRMAVVLSHSRFTVTAGAVVIDEQNRVLLLHHRFRGGSGWGIPGGFLNRREHPDAALRRELREEIGLEMDNLEVAFVHTLLEYQQIEVVFRATPRNDVQIRSAEISRAEWFDVNALPAEVSTYQRWLIERAISPHGHTKAHRGEHDT